MKTSKTTIFSILIILVATQSITAATESNCTPGKCTACSVENIDDKPTLTCNSCFKSKRVKVSEDIYKCEGVQAINPRCVIDKADPAKGCSVCERGYMYEVKDGKKFCLTKRVKNCEAGTENKCEKCRRGYVLDKNNKCMEVTKKIDGCSDYIMLAGDKIGCSLCKEDNMFVTHEFKSCKKASEAQKGCQQFFTSAYKDCKACNFGRRHFAIGAKETTDGKQIQKCEIYKSDFWLWVYCICGVVLVTAIVAGILIVKNRTKSKQADLFNSMINETDE